MLLQYTCILLTRNIGELKTKRYNSTHLLISVINVQNISIILRPK